METAYLVETTHLDDLVELVAVVGLAKRDVLPDRGREDPRLLRHVEDAASHAHGRRLDHVGQLAEQGVKKRALSRAHRAHDGDQLAALHAHTHVLEPECVGLLDSVTIGPCAFQSNETHIPASNLHSDRSLLQPDRRRTSGCADPCGSLPLIRISVQMIAI